MKLSLVLLPIVLTSWLNVACASTTTNPVTNTANPNAATTAYEPVRGQAGKDVIWIPTPEGLIDKMLSAAKVTDQDRLFDLGAGDGIIAITAARKYGAQSVGIEYNPDMAQFARRKVAEAGVSDKVKIITGDIFIEDFSAATVVTLYLMPHLNLKLRPILLKMKPGTRVVSHAFNMGDWEPDETMSYQHAQGYFWVVPAQIEGDWLMTGLDGATLGTESTAGGAAAQRADPDQQPQRLGRLRVHAAARQPAHQRAHRQTAEDIDAQRAPRKGVAGTCEIGHHSPELIAQHRACRPASGDRQSCKEGGRFTGHRPPLARVGRSA